MREGDTIIKGQVKAYRQRQEGLQKGLMCLFGKLEWNFDYHPVTNFNEYDMDVTKHAVVTIVFEGFPCTNLIPIYQLIKHSDIPWKFDENQNVFKIPGIRIEANSDVYYDLFCQAFKHLYNIALSEVPDSCKNGEIVIVDHALDKQVI